MKDHLASDAATRLLPPDLLHELESACLRSADAAARAAALAALQAQHPAHAAGIAAYAAALQAAPGAWRGQAIGPYRVVGELGRGGFGEVLLAEQTAPVLRRVALKVLKLGMDSRAILQRFAREQAALARMNHDAVAKLYDAGITAAGQPYFAMELVEGPPLTAYCRQADLPLRERVALFAKVCQGVQHAHQKGVLHRDLKPGNVLVATAGGVAQPKLIDFGISRAIEGDGEVGLTETGMVLGTPAYMAPEQARGEAAAVDTRTDVYALGAMLFELVSEQAPPAARGDGTPLPRPSAQATTAAWRRQLRGDLDWVVLKAMAPEPERRYGTAAELAADLERFLRHEPVLAGPPSTAYRLRKFVRRYRLLVAAVAAVLLTAAVGSGVALQYAEAARAAAQQSEQLAQAASAAQQAAERSAAAAQAAEAAERARVRSLQRVTEFQGELLQRIDLAGAGARLRAALAAGAGAGGSSELPASLQRLDFVELMRGVFDREVLAAAETTLDTALKDEDEPRVQLLQSLADTAQSLGALERAERLQRAALAALVALPRHPEGDVASMRAKLARLLHRRGTLAEAIGTWRELLADATAAGRESPDLISGLSWSLLEADQIDEAYELTRPWVDRLPADAAARDVDAAAWELLAVHGEVLRRRGDLTAAEALLGRLVSVQRERHGASSELALRATGNHAVVLRELQRLPEAETRFREILAVRRESQGSGHPDTLMAMHNVGAVLVDRQQLADGRALLEQVLAGRIALFGEGHPDTEMTRQMVGWAARLQGDRLAAWPLYAASLAASEARLGADHATALGALATLAAMEVEAGDPAAARQRLEPALARVRQRPGALDATSLSLLLVLADAHAAAGAAGEATAIALEALTAYRRAFGAVHPMVARCSTRYVQLLLPQRRFAEALAERRELLAACRERLGDRHGQTLEAWNSVGFVLQASGDFAAAETEFAAAHAAMAAAFGPRDPRTLDLWANLAFVRKQQGRLADAEPIYRDVLRIAREDLGPRHPTVETAQRNLASLLSDQRRYDEAVSLLQELLVQREAGQSAAAPEALVLAAEIGLLLARIGRLEEAYALLSPREAALRGKPGSPTTRRRADALLGLGAAIAGLRRVAEYPRGVAALTDAHAAFSSGPGANPAAARSAARQLAELHQHWHQVDPAGDHAAAAAVWRERAAPAERGR